MSPRIAHPHSSSAVGSRHRLAGWRLFVFPGRRQPVQVRRSFCLAEEVLEAQLHARDIRLSHNDNPLTPAISWLQFYRLSSEAPTDAQAKETLMQRHSSNLGRRRRLCFLLPLLPALLNVSPCVRSLRDKFRPTRPHQHQLRWLLHFIHSALAEDVR